MWKYHPIALWTHEDVRNYFVTQKIPQNKLYEKVDRSGCMPCTGFLKWQEQLSKANPKMYRYVQKLRGTSLITDFLEFENELADQCGEKPLEL